MYRSSTGALDRFDDEPPRGGERWDRSRFEDMKSRAGSVRDDGSQRGGSVRGGEHEHFRFQEHDRFPGGRRDIDIHEDRDRRGPPVNVMERDVFHDRYDRPPPARRRDNLFDEQTPSEIANQALAPYRRKSVINGDIASRVDIDVRSTRRPPRPQFMRRQSSLDTFDRRPVPRYGDLERDEYRPPTNVPIPLPIREGRRSPPRRYRDADDYEDYHFTEREGRGRDREEFREIEIHREKSRVRRGKSDAKSEAKSEAKSSRSSSISSFEEIQPPRATWGKKGRTRLPKRLVKREAVIELGYPFEEEDDFIVITRALEKEHIDEVIKTSEGYKEVEKTTYVYEEQTEERAPPRPQSVYDPPPPPKSVYDPPPPPKSVYDPPPPPQSVYAAPPPPQSVYAVPPPPQSVYAMPPPPQPVYAQPPPPPQSVHMAPLPPAVHYAPPARAPSVHAPPPPPPPAVHFTQPYYAQSQYAQSVREPSPPRYEHEHEEYVKVERSNAIHGPATAFLPEARQLVVRRDDRGRSEREIREEIRSLEEERRMLKYEREGEYEIIERREPKKEVVRVDRDRKVRRTKDRPNPKVVAAMMGTLS